MVLHLHILREEVCDDVPHPEMGESPIAIEYSGEKCFADGLRNLIFLCTLEVYPFFEFSCCFRMVAVEVSRGDDVCPRRDVELAWIRMDDKRGSRCHDYVYSGYL